jgi:hypothetical protein
VSGLIGRIGRTHEGRSATGQSPPKLQELVHADLWDYSSVEGELTPFDAYAFRPGRAMLNVARRGGPMPILEQRDIARASARRSAPLKADATYC